MPFADIHVTWTTSCGTSGHKDFPERTSTQTIQDYISVDNKAKCGVNANVKVILI